MLLEQRRCSNSVNFYAPIATALDYLGVNSYMPNQEDLMADIGLVMFSTILQEDFTKIINSYGNALTASFMDDASRKTFVDSAK